MQRYLLVLAALPTLLAVTPSSFAREAAEQATLTESEPAKQWYRINLIKWKPGKAERAHEIILEIQKVDIALGYQVTDYHLATGSWDSIVAKPLDAGVSEFVVSDNAEEARWFAELSRQQGGEANAAALLEELNSLALIRESHIAHVDDRRRPAE